MLDGEAPIGFRGYRLDPLARELLAPDGAPVQLTARAFDVLLYLVRHRDRIVGKDELLSEVWAGRVVEENNLTQAVSGLRRALGTGAGDRRFIVTLPGRGYRFVAPVDPPPDSTSPMAPAADASRPRRRSLAPLLLLMGVVLAASLVLDRNGPASDRGPPQAPGQVAGAPALRDDAAGVAASGATAARPLRVELHRFSAPAADADLAALSNRLAASIANRLPGLGAVSAAPDVAIAGMERLTVAGSVDRDGESVQVTGRILDTDSGFVLWSARMKRPGARLAGLEEEFAIGLAATLRCAREARGTDGRWNAAETFSLLLRTCEALILDRNEGFEAASALARAAPDLPAAHALLAVAASRAADEMLHSPEERASLLAIARAAGARAAELAPEDPLVFTARSRLAGSLAEREALLRRALQAQPDLPPALMAYIYFLREVGRLASAAELSRRALSMEDPRVIAGLPNAAFLAAMAGDEESVERAIARYDELYPGRGDGLRWTIAVWWGDPAMPLPPPPPPHDARHQDCFQVVRARLARGQAPAGIPDSCDSLGPMWRVRLLARLGHLDAAFSGFRALDARQALPQVVFYPEMREFRLDPRFPEVAEELGLAEYWRTTGNWPDFCAEQDGRQVCEQLAHGDSGRTPAPQAP